MHSQYQYTGLHANRLLSIQPMIKATKVIRQGKGLAKPLIERARRLELRWDMRRMPSFSAASSDGGLVHVSLPDEQPLRGGDVLVAEDGSLLRVVAAKQPLMRVSPGAEHGNDTDLALAAYQLGRWGTDIGFDGMHLLVEPHAEIRALLQNMHLRVDDLESAFEPVDPVALSPRYAVIEPPRRRLILGPAILKKQYPCGDSDVKANCC